MPDHHVILCGLGELGFRTLERLVAFGDRVVVLDPEPDPAFLRQLDDWAIPLHRERGNSARALRDAGIKEARALIAVAHDDMTNLAIALAAREENPDIRLVVRMFNHRLMEKVEREIPHCRVLDVAALSAPVFALAGVQNDVQHCIDVPGARYLLRHWRQSVPPEAKILAVKRMPGGIVSEERMEGQVPTPYWELVPRETGPLERKEIAIGLLLADEATVGTKGSRSEQQTPWVRLRAFLEDTRRLARAMARHPLIRVLLFILGIAVLSAGIFHRSLNLPWHEAVYFVVTVMTTTGFGDISLRHASPAVVLYGTGLMLVGAMLMAVLYAFLTDFLLTSRLAPLLGQRLYPLRDHFILCGFGTVGYRIAEELQAMGQHVVAIDRQENSQLAERARRSGVQVIVSQDVYSAMANLHVEYARGVLAVTDNDVQNMELAVSVQESNPRARVVARLFDPTLARLVERSFGIHLVRSPSAIAAPAFAVAAAADDLIDAFELGEVLWCVGQLTLQEGDALVGIRPPQLVGSQILTLSIQRHGGEWQAPVPNDWRLEAGDKLVIVTPRTTWLALNRVPTIQSTGSWS